MVCTVSISKGGGREEERKKKERGTGEEGGKEALAANY